MPSVSYAMPNYRYTAVDASGKTVEGTILAGSLREVSQGLRQRGLKVSQITEAGPATAAAAPTPPPALSPQPVSQPAPVAVAPRPPAVAASAPPVRAQPAAVDTVRTRIWRDKDIFLLFSQIANYLRSGISPQQAFHDLQRRVTRKDYADSLAEIRSATSAGKTISEAMERYPDLYPPHVVGIMRAGEQGGFMVQAADRIAAHATSSMRWARPFWIVRWMVVAMLLAMPLAFVAIQGTLETYTSFEKSGGTGSILQMIVSNSAKLLTWPLGPIIAIGLGVVYLITLWWKSRGMRYTRHRIALTWPIFGKRSMAEGATIFAWSLSHLSQAGISPHMAWPLAVETVPNLVYKERLLRAGQMMREKTPISEAVLRSEVLPNEMTMLVQTGEATGSVPGALMDSAMMSEAEFDGVEQQSRRLVWSWIALLYGLGFVFYLWLIYRYFYPNLIDRVTSDIDPEAGGFLRPFFTFRR